MAKEPRLRDWRQEKESGQLELLRGLEIVKKERESQLFDVIQLAQIFAFCSLPYRPTEERQITRTARLGNGSSVEVTFTAMRPKVPLAFGNDRNLLYWLVDQAIRRQSPFIPWESASEYLKAMGQAESGRNRELLRERFRRVASMAVTVVRTSDVEKQDIVPIFRRMVLPVSVTGREEDRHKEHEEPLGVNFDKDFVADFMSHRIPILKSLLVATQARPQMQDCMFFLIWRSYSAASDSIIDWEKLRDQFWQADSNRSRIRLRFKEAIALIKTVWSELRAEARLDGLWIGPPRHHVHFVPQLNRPLHTKVPTALLRSSKSSRETVAAKMKREREISRQESFFRTLAENNKDQ